ncbi:S26 family signal peptidase [candidate division WOR-3 bacterium]|nr:S26 family signal peptidase [candidate division WOR-3 bacterium]
MSPFILDGDVITIAPLARDGPGIGQIVAFVNPVNRRLVVHRIVGRHELCFLIQGDNLPERAVTRIDRDSVLGRVVRVERGWKCIWLGLGPERFAIALLSRLGLLIPARARAGTLVRFLKKRRHQGASQTRTVGVRDA